MEKNALFLADTAQGTIS